MDITWYGHSCFRIVERGQPSVVTDPYAADIGLTPPRPKADIVTVSHDVPGHNAIETLRGEPHIIGGPGEYEIGGVFITGVAMHTEHESNPRYNVAYLIEMANGLTVLHLGDLSHVPDQSTIQAFGTVNVLLIPVGGGNAMHAPQAAEVIALVEPNYVVPMHYQIPGLSVELDSVDRFLKAMGVSKVQQDDLLRVSPTTLPEQPQVIVLEPRTSE